MSVSDGSKGHGLLPAEPSARATAPRLLVPFLAVIAVGVILRVYAISDQVIIDDEYHAIGVALGFGYGHILSHFFQADNSIPMTLLYKALADTVGLSEILLRLPQLVCGILLLAVFPLVARHLLHPRERLLYGALLAVSPQLIFYSRYARPYEISTFCCGIALVAFARFCRRGGTGSALFYWASASVAVYFQPLAFPFALAPACFAALTLLARRGPAGVAQLRRVTAVGAAVALTVGGLFAPAALRSGGAVTGKMGEAHYSSSTFYLAFRLAAGVTNGSVAAGMAILACLGAVVLLRRDAWLASCLLFSVVAQLVATVVIAPYLGHHFYIFARYNLWTLPVLLLFVAAGTTAFRGAGGIAVTVALSLIATFSPLWSAYRMPSNFTNQERFQIQFVYPGLAERRDRHMKEHGSVAYDWLAAQSLGTVIAEAPWYHFNSGIFYGDSQRLHGKPVVVVMLDQASDSWLAVRDPRLRLRTFVAEDPQSLSARGVDYLVVHKDLRAEAIDLGLEMPPVRDFDLEPSRRIWEAAFGPPVVEDRWVWVYAVTAGPHRREASAGIRAPIGWRLRLVWFNGGCHQASTNERLDEWRGAYPALAAVCRWASAAEPETTAAFTQGGLPWRESRSESADRSARSG